MGNSWHMSNARNFGKQVSIMKPTRQLEVVMDVVTTMVVAVVTSAVAMAVRRTTTTTLILTAIFSASCVGTKGMPSRSVSSGLTIPFLVRRRLQHRPLHPME
jgi:hypothetical protein